MNIKKYCLLIMIFLMVLPVMGFAQTSSDLIDMMPAGTDAAIHVNIGNIIRLPYVDGLMQEFSSEEEALEIFSAFDEILVCTDEIGADLMNTNGFSPFIYLKGDYQRGDIKQNFDNMGENYEDIIIEGIEGIRVSDTTILFYSNDIMAFTFIENEYRLAEILNNPGGNDAIDSQSAFYKKANSMKSNVMWMVADLGFLGVIDFASLGIPITENTALNLADLSISLVDENFNIASNIEVAEEGVSSTLAEFMKASIQMLAPTITNSLPAEMSHLKGYITNAINSISMTGLNDIISLTLSVEMVLVEELINYSLMEQQIDDGISPDDYDGGEIDIDEAENWGMDYDSDEEPEWEDYPMDETEEPVETQTDEETNQPEEGEDVVYVQPDEDVGVDVADIDKMLLGAEQVLNIHPEESVFFENVVIEDDLDLASLGQMDMISNNETKSYVDKSITFIKTDFTNDIIAYQKVQNEISHYTEFMREVTFIGCTFKGSVDFRHALFKSGAKFIDCVFEAGVMFDEVEFQSEAIFRETLFATPAHFNNVEFSKGADFNQAIFVWEALFNWSVFDGDADFRNSEFQSDANFSKAIFKSDVYFSSAVMKLRPNEDYEIEARPAMISGDAYFGLAQFTGGIYFNSVLIGGDAYFRGAKFLTYADFRSVSFEGDVDFVTAQFAGDAYFVSAMFYGETNFEEVLFNTKAQFEKARWMSKVSFLESQFNGYAYFSMATFEDDVKFDTTQFIGYAYFKEATFDGEASFVNVLFNGKVTFKDAVFNSEADFSGALLNGNPYDPTK